MLLLFDLKLNCANEVAVCFGILTKSDTNEFVQLQKITNLNYKLRSYTIAQFLTSDVSKDPHP